MKKLVHGRSYGPVFSWRQQAKDQAETNEHLVYTVLGCRARFLLLYPAINIHGHNEKALTGDRYPDSFWKTFHADGVKAPDEHTDRSSSEEFSQKIYHRMRIELHCNDIRPAQVQWKLALIQGRGTGRNEFLQKLPHQAIQKLTDNTLYCFTMNIRISP